MAAFAVVPDGLAGCYGSGKFPMFSPDRAKLDPRWIHWLTKTSEFWAQCDEKSQGTSGQNYEIVWDARTVPFKAISKCDDADHSIPLHACLA